jgi:single-strand DNA-binding protein
MKQGLNKFQGMGNVGKDPEVKQFDNGGKIAKISIACNETWKDKQTGEKKEFTEWVNVEFTYPLADVVEQYVKKGDAIYIEGKLKTDQWQAEDGSNRYMTKIRAFNLIMLGGQQQGQQQSNPAGQSQTAQAQQAQQTQTPEANETDELPF